MKLQPPGSDEFVDCDNPTVDASGNRRAPRGVCGACYHSFIDYLKTLPDEERVKVEQDAIAKGWILALQEQRTLKSRYAFGKLGA